MQRFVLIFMSLLVAACLFMGIFSEVETGKGLNGAKGMHLLGGLSKELGEAVLVTFQRNGLTVILGLLLSGVTALPAAYHAYRGHAVKASLLGSPWQILLLIPQFFWLFLLGSHRDILVDRYFFWVWSGAITLTFCPQFYAQQYAAAWDFFRSRHFDALVVVGYSRLNAVWCFLKGRFLMLYLVQFIYGLSMVILVGAAFGHAGLVNVTGSPVVAPDLVSGLAKNYNQAKYRNPLFDIGLVPFWESFKQESLKIMPPKEFKLDSRKLEDGDEIFLGKKGKPARARFFAYLIFTMVLIAWLQSLFMFMQSRLLTNDTGFRVDKKARGGNHPFSVLGPLFRRNCEREYGKR